MDYEKKYNETLERFKAFKEKYYTKDTNLGDAIYDKTGEMQKDFENIFPELAESENERIYNEIMEFFKMNEKWCIVDNSYAKWISWLEKQKEISESDAFALLSKKGYVILERNAYNELCEEAEKSQQGFAPDELQKSFEEGQKSIVCNPERYGLCKRVEWSKSDIWALNLAISIINGKPISRCGNDLQECITRLKCIRDVLMTTPSELSMVDDGS